LAFASLAGFAAAAAFAIASYVTRPQEAPASHRVSFNLTPPAGAEFQFSPTGGGAVISPDGRSVALVAVANGTPRLWIRTLDSTSARELRDTDGARLPFWSPDNRSIGFFANSKLRRIDISEGVAVDLAPAPDPRGGTWNSDGTIVFSPTAFTGLQRVSASGGTPAPLTTLAAGNTSHRWPRFLPDGRSLLYYAIGQNAGAFLTTLDRPGTATRVAPGALAEVLYFQSPARDGGYLLWVAQDKLFAQRFDPASGQLSRSPVSVPDTEDIASSLGTNRGSMSVSNDGTLLYGTGGTRFRLSWFGADGAPLGQVGDAAQYIGLRLSPSGGDALVTIREGENGDLWRIDLARGARSRITSGGGGWYATWSPDGEQLAFTPLNGVDVVATNARGAGQVETLWRYGARAFVGDWSRNGQLLAFSAARTDAANDVFVLNLQGERMLRPVLASPFTELHPQFSPNGRWLAFTSDEVGREDVYVQSFPDARTRKVVSIGGGGYPRWSHDGRQLFYRAADGRLVSVPVLTKGSSLEFGSPRTIMRLVEPPALHPYPYDVAPDGRILALTAASEGAQGMALTVLMNWQSALEP
jgi:Tol biopolymer transport system component